MTDVNVLKDLVNAANDAVRQAQDKLFTAHADFLREGFLALEKHGIVEFSFNTGSEYNDEDGYDLYTSVTFTDDAGADHDVEDVGRATGHDRLYDYVHDAPQQTFGLLTGDKAGAWDGSTTLADLRTRTF